MLLTPLMLHKHVSDFVIINILLLHLCDEHDVDNNNNYDLISPQHRSRSLGTSFARMTIALWVLSADSARVSRR